MNSNTIQATKLLTHYRCGRLPRPDEVHFGKIGEASTTQYKDNFQSEFQALSESDNGPQDLHPEWGVVDFPLSGRRRLDRREYSGDGKEGRITETVVSDRATFIEERTVGNAGYDNVQIIVKDGYERVHLPVCACCRAAHLAALSLPRRPLVCAWITNAAFSLRSDCSA